MKPPKDDIQSRTPVWESLQMLFMDVQPADNYDAMVEVCGRSPYTLSEIEAIVSKELLPALRFNLMNIAGEWRGFETQWLVNRILEKNRFGKRGQYGFRKYAQAHFEVLRPRIERWRKDNAI